MECLQLYRLGPQQGSCTEISQERGGGNQTEQLAKRISGI